MYPWLIAPHTSNGMARMSSLQFSSTLATHAVENRDGAGVGQAQDIAMPTHLGHRGLEGNAGSRVGLPENHALGLVLHQRRIISRLDTFLFIFLISQFFYFLPCPFTFVAFAPFLWHPAIFSAFQGAGRDGIGKHMF